MSPHRDRHSASKFLTVGILFAIACGSGDGGGRIEDGGAAGGGTGGSSGGAGTGGDAGGGGDTGAGGDIGAGGDAGGTIAVFGTVTAYGFDVPDSGGFGSWSGGDPAAGMQICLRGASLPCATTSANGAYRLEGVPANSQIALLFEHADVAGRTLLQRVTRAVDFNESPLATTEGFNRYLSGSGCSVPAASASGSLYIGTPPGASITLTPTPSSPLVYFGDSGFDPAATQIAASIDPSLAAAVVCGLAPGEYDIDFHGTSGTCRMAEGWPTTGHDVRAVVEAGAMTVINWICN